MKGSGSWAVDQELLASSAGVGSMMLFSDLRISPSSRLLALRSSSISFLSFPCSYIATTHRHFDIYWPPPYYCHREGVNGMENVGPQHTVNEDLYTCRKISLLTSFKSRTWSRNEYTVSTRVLQAKYEHHWRQPVSWDPHWYWNYTIKMKIIDDRRWRLTSPPWWFGRPSPPQWSSSPPQQSAAEASPAALPTQQQSGWNTASTSQWHQYDTQRGLGRSEKSDNLPLSFTSAIFHISIIYPAENSITKCQNSVIIFQNSIIITLYLAYFSLAKLLPIPLIGSKKFFI